MHEPVDRRAFVTRLGGLAAAAGITATIPGRIVAAVTAADQPAKLGSRYRGAGSWIPSDALLERLPTIMELAVVPAVSMAVVEEGAIAWARALGKRDTASGAAADQTTIFEAASLSKPTVAHVTLGLVDQGKLDLDRPLAEYFAPPDLASDARTRRITGRHILTHSSGLPNWRPRNQPALQAAFEPGSRFSYSGEGFTWLQRVLEQLTGQGFAALLRQRILEPAGMTSSNFLWRPDMADRLALGYNRQGEGREGPAVRLTKELRQATQTGRPLEEWHYEDVQRWFEAHHSNLPAIPQFLVPNAAASLLTTATDYARFTLRLMTGAPAVPFALREATRQRMLSPAITVNGPLSWGLGIGLEQTADGTLFWHWGDNGNYKAFVVGDPQHRRALTVFTNGYGGDKVYQRVVRDAVGEDLASLIWV